MKSKKVKIINCYFGKLPVMFELWLYTCTRNPEFDFLIVTDQEVRYEASNIEILNVSFEELKKKIAEKLPYRVEIKKPYKLCDFKITYGLVFEDYLIGYDFWGYCDNDMLFGDLSKFITDDMLEQYSKILYLGHLSLYKNLEEINKIPIMKNELINWESAYATSSIYGLDEDKGIYQIYKRQGISVYDKRIFFDIDPYSSYIRLDNIINRRMGKNVDINYRKQIFVWSDGCIYRYYMKKGKLHREEAAYIHCGKNKIATCDIISENSMLIFSNQKIYAVTKKNIKKDDFSRYNRYSMLIVLCDQIKRYIHKIKNKVGRMRLNK